MRSRKTVRHAAVGVSDDFSAASAVAARKRHAIPAAKAASQVSVRATPRRFPWARQTQQIFATGSVTSFRIEKGRTSEMGGALTLRATEAFGWRTVCGGLLSQAEHRATGTTYG